MTIDAMSWYGMFAPAKTPPAIVSRLNAEAQAALKSPLVRERLRDAAARAGRQLAGASSGLSSTSR